MFQFYQKVYNIGYEKNKSWIDNKSKDAIKKEDFFLFNSKEIISIMYKMQ
jgi:hypothetical protein